MEIILFSLKLNFNILLTLVNDRNIRVKFKDLLFIYMTSIIHLYIDTVKSIFSSKTV